MEPDTGQTGRRDLETGQCAIPHLQDLGDQDADHPTVGDQEAMRGREGAELAPACKHPRPKGAKRLPLRRVEATWVSEKACKLGRWDLGGSEALPDPEIALAKVIHQQQGQPKPKG